MLRSQKSSENQQVGSQAEHSQLSASSTSAGLFAPKRKQEQLIGGPLLERFEDPDTKYPYYLSRMGNSPMYNETNMIEWCFFNGFREKKLFYTLEDLHKNVYSEDVGVYVVYLSYSEITDKNIEKSNSMYLLSSQKISPESFDHYLYFLEPVYHMIPDEINEQARELDDKKSKNLIEDYKRTHRELRWERKNPKQYTRESRQQFFNSGRSPSRWPNPIEYLRTHFSSRV